MTRRSEIAKFKQEAGGELTTFLVAADEKLDHNPLLAQARSRWLIQRSIRKPYCFSCRASLASAPAAAFLFSTPANAPTSSVSISALCARCWNNLTDDEIERAALKVMRKLVPGAEWPR